MHALNAYTPPPEHWQSLYSILSHLPTRNLYLLSINTGEWLYSHAIFHFLLPREPLIYTAIGVMTGSYSKGQMIGLGINFIILPAIAVGLRVWAKLLKIRRLACDDYLIFAALVRKRFRSIRPR